MWGGWQYSWDWCLIQDGHLKCLTAQPRESKALNILILIQSASCQIWVFIFVEQTGNRTLFQTGTDASPPSRVCVFLSTWKCALFALMKGYYPHTKRFETSYTVKWTHSEMMLTPFISSQFTLCPCPLTLSIKLKWINALKEKTCICSTWFVLTAARLISCGPSGWIKNALCLDCGLFVRHLKKVDI